MGFKGNLVSANAAVTSYSSSSGIWKASDQIQANFAGNWPKSPFAVYTVSYLIIAGGGGGSTFRGGGGGAGGDVAKAITPTAGTAYPFQGYISGFRVANTAIYTANFTPSTSCSPENATIAL